MTRKLSKRIFAIVICLAVILSYSNLTAVSVHADTEQEKLSSYGFFKWMSTNTNATADEREDARIAVQILEGNVESSYSSKVFNNNRITAGSTSGATYETLQSNTHFGQENDATSLENLRAAIEYVKLGNTYRAKEGLSALNISSGLMAMGEMDANYIGVSWGHSLIFYSLENLSRGGASWAEGNDNYNPYVGWYDEEKVNFDTKNGGVTGHYKTLTDRNGVDVKVTGIGVAESKSGGWYYKGVSQMHSGSTKYYTVGSGTTPEKYLKYVTEYTCMVKGHTWGEWTTTQPATCTAAGSKKHICSVCGKTETATISSLGHSWNSGVVTTEPTCVATGVKTFTCTRCNDTKTETLAKDLSNHIHKSTINASAATCTVSGYTGDVKCNDCGVTVITGSVINATGHQHKTTVGAVAATCTASGYTGDVKCNDCGVTVTTGSVINATGHSWGSGTVTKKATCTETGIRKYTCSLCGDTKTETIPALGHNWNSGVVTTTPTCVATGVKTFTCTRCNNTKTETLAIDSSNHVHESIVNAVAATCTSSGYTGDVKCNDCGVTVTTGSVINATGHQHKKTVGAVAATCTLPGYTGDVKCLDCGAVVTNGNVVAAKGHSWNNGYLSKYATCNEQGEKTYRCTSCGDTKVEKTGFDSDLHLSRVTSGIVSETCTRDGFTGRTVCGYCGKVLSEGTVVKATGHSWNEGVITKAPTTQSTGIKTYTCKTCGSQKTTVLAKLPLIVNYSVPATNVNVNNATAVEADKALQAVKGDGDLKGSTYSALQLKNTKNTKTSIKLSWKKVKGAKKYVLYGSKCGSKLKKIKTTTKASYTKGKLKKGTYYKYMLVAIGSNNKVIGSSKVIHVCTTGGKVCNIKKITSVNSKTSKTIKKGKTFKWKTKVVKQQKKLTLKTHRKVKYESTNKKIATVSSSGKIKAVKKGTCYIYAYGQNGVGTKIKVRVK